MASTGLTKAFGAGNRRTWTLSLWVKRSGLTGVQTIMAQEDGWNGNGDAGIYFEGSKISSYNLGDTLNSGNSSKVETNRDFRDTNAWYHLVFRFDTTQSTASDRFRIYVNGVQETSMLYSNYPSQNYEPNFNRSTRNHGIGKQESGTAYAFDGSMSHIHFCDGYSYDASAFGETDATTGEWKAKTSPSVTYGTNGFFILKDGNGITDQSGEGNDFTLGGGTLTDLKDNPDNVFATYNSLPRLGDFNILSNGNTTQKETSGVGQRQAICNIGNITGKFYAEFKMINLGPQDGSSPYCGVLSMDKYTYNTWLGSVGLGFHPNGNVYKSDSIIDSQTSITYTTNSIVSVALDITNNKCHFRVNGGTWLASGNPVNNTGGYDISSLNTGDALTFASSVYNNNCQWDANFGNGYFGTTAVSSAGTNASDNGIFEYDVPTGYTALSTKGLNL